MDDYKKRQMESEDRDWVNYHHKEVVLTPAQRFYGCVEYSNVVELLERFGLTELDRVLVCGAGGGEDLEYWLRHLQVRACIGLDFSAEGLRAARRRAFHHNLPNIVEYVKADIEAIPLRDSSVDLAFVARSMHHLLEPGLGFREMFRVCKRGMVVLEPADTFFMPFFKWIGVARQAEHTGNVVLRFRRQDFESYLEGCNYSMEFRTCLYYYHPLINGQLMRLFDFPGGVRLLRGLHKVAEVLFFPLRSKCLVFIRKLPDALGS